MLGYVAFVAVLNLFLGYALATYLKTGGRSAAPHFGRDLEMSARADRPALSQATAKVRDRPMAVDATEENVLAETVPPASDLSGATDTGLTGEDELFGTVDPSPAPPIAPTDWPSDPDTGLASRDYAEQLLADLATLVGPQQGPAAVALIELDQADGVNRLIADRVLGGVANAVRELLAEAHLAARFADQQFLLLLPGDDESHATQRAEQVRQRIEATEFVANGQGLHATVTCALAQVASESSVARLLESLQETLEEAKRYGGNRTFLYDGVSPAPVVPPELNCAPQKCAI